MKGLSEIRQGTRGHCRPFDTLLFGRQNCKIRQRGDHLELTFLDMGQGELQSAIGRLLESRSERGLNRVAWWGGLGLKVKFENQYTKNT